MRASRCLLLLILFLLPLQSADARAITFEGPGWNLVSDSRVTVHYRGPSEAFANQVLERAGTFLESTSRFLGLPWLNRYSIVIANSREEFFDLQPTAVPAPEWAGALTYPGLKLVLIMTPTAMDSGGSRYWSLLQHEMAHLILGDAESRHSTRLPRWLQEGIATYVSGEMSLQRLVQLGWAQATGATPQFRDLEFNFPDQSSRAGAAYARSYLFIKYLTQRFGDDAVARLLAGSFQNGGINRGVTAAFDLSLAELLSGFDQYARVKATWIPVITSTATIWGLITLLFLVTWMRKKVQGLRTVSQWEKEEELERLATSLHIQNSYDDFDENESHDKKPTLH